MNPETTAFAARRRCGVRVSAFTWLTSEFFRMAPQRALQSPAGSSAVELMIATPTVQELLLNGKTRELYKALKEGGYYGCMTFNQSLKSLLERDLITLEDALNAADSPDELKLELRGISKDAQRHFGAGGRR